jgi:hypothetical protein
VVTICLGQNDGIQDEVVFCNNYISFIKKVRGYYPKATIVCLTSPMADATLTTFMRKTLTAIVNAVHKAEDKKVSHYFFPNGTTMVATSILILQGTGRSPLSWLVT